MSTPNCNNCFVRKLLFLLDSGRHVPSATKNIRRVIVSSGGRTKFTGKAVVVYKRTNKPMSMRNINDVIYFVTCNKTHLFYGERFRNYFLRSLTWHMQKEMQWRLYMIF